MSSVGVPAVVPIMGYNSIGKFAISNYNATLFYTATNISGGGTATLNVGTGIYTLSATTSRWSVTASFANGAPVTVTDHMERLPHSYTADTRYTYACGSYSCNCRWGNCGCECAGGGCGCYGTSAQSWGQCGCPGTMCWYNWICDTCTSYCEAGSAPALINQPGYINGGSEWYRIS